MSFMKQDKQDRVLQRKVDMEERANQREEDMNMIKDMIDKVVAVKVQAALNPVEEKLELQEKVNQELYKELNSLTKELECLKQRCNSTTLGIPVVAEPQAPQDLHGASQRRTALVLQSRQSLYPRWWVKRPHHRNTHPQA